MRPDRQDQINQDMLQWREDHAATQGFAGGLVVGILLGVVLALVFAPRRGDETRAAVALAAHDVLEKTTHLVSRGTSPEGGTDFGDVAAIEREFGVPAGGANPQ